MHKQKTKQVTHIDLNDIQNLSTTSWNPISSISELPFHEAKKIMLKVYNHKLTEEEYLLMPTAESLLDFFTNKSGRKNSFTKGR